MKEKRDNLFPQTVLFPDNQKINHRPDQTSARHNPIGSFPT